MIYLKTKNHKGFADMGCALLVEPDVPLHNNEELYAAVKTHGEAVIHEFDSNNPLKLKPNQRTLTPSEFEQNWQGD